MMTDADSDTFDVVLRGFAAGGVEPPVEALVRVFGITNAAATRLLAHLPATVQRGVPGVRADYFRHALVLIGADVEIRPATRGRTHPPPGASGADRHRGSTPAEAPHQARAPRPSPAPPEPGPPPAPSPGDDAPAPPRAVAPRSIPPEVPLPPLPNPQHRPSEGPQTGWGRLLGLSMIGQPPPQAARPGVACPPLQVDRASGDIELQTGDDEPALELAHSMPSWQAPAPKPPAPAPPPPPQPLDAQPLPSTAEDKAIAEPAAKRPSLPPPSPAAPARPATGLGESFVRAATVAFTGHGLGWSATVCAGYGSLAVLLQAAHRLPGWLGIGGLVCAGLCACALVALTIEFFQQIFWATIKGRPGLPSGPGVRPRCGREGYLRSGATFVLFGLIGLAPLALHVLRGLQQGGTGAELSRTAPPWLLGLGPLWYLPMAVTTATLGRRAAAVWSLWRGLRAALRVPVRYGLVCLSALAGAGLASGGAVLLGLLAGRGVGAVALGLPVATATALSAVRMAHLVADRPELFR